MAPLHIVAALSALLAGVSAQSDDDGSHTKVWAAVVFVNHGENTPADSSTSRTVLTPEGAQQMWRQGNVFRSRYLNASDANATDSAPIEGMQHDVVDNTVIDIYSQSEEYVAGGAMAFLQGLYPPQTKSFNTLSGGSDISHDYADNSTVEYPMDGYQYPFIQTLSDENSLSSAIQGTVQCQAWETQMAVNLTARDDLVHLANSTSSFYQKLFSTSPLLGTMSLEDANFWHATEVNDLVQYLYRHNETVNGDLADANTTLTNLANHAFSLESARNSLVSDDKDDSLNVLYTIAGRTLADTVAEQFESNIGWNSGRYKLTLMFGSFQPLMAFFSISGMLSNGQKLTKPFASLPQPGAALVFELIGEDEDFPDVQPSKDNLRVRVYYRASADDGEEFQSQSLFNSGFDGASIPYTAFDRTMKELGRGSSEWCDICAPTQAAWCNTTSSSGDNGKDSSSSSRGKSSMSLPVAGIIGAVIMGAIIALIGLGLFVIGGFRFSRSDPKERKSSLGGFKGAEKMASDTDVRVGKGGAQQERVGSWELQDGGASPTTGQAGIVTEDFHRNERRNGDDEDGISVMGATPVNVRESV